jgi:hypothetical protein
MKKKSWTWLSKFSVGCFLIHEYIRLFRVMAIRKAAEERAAQEKASKEAQSPRKKNRSNSKVILLFQLFLAPSNIFVGTQVSSQCQIAKISSRLFHLND